jgi:urease subunit gamma/beta
MRLTPTERDRLLLFTAAELARARRLRGLRLNVPETIALVADTVCEAARDGVRLTEAIAAGKALLGPDDVLPDVAYIVREVQVEAVFDDGTHLAVVQDPIGEDATGPSAPGIPAGQTHVIDGDNPDPIDIEVVNMGAVPITITSHFHFFEVNRHLRFDRVAAYGRRLAVRVGETVRFEPRAPRTVTLIPIAGARIAIGFAGLVDGALDDPVTRERAMVRARETGYLQDDLS